MAKDRGYLAKIGADTSGLEAALKSIRQQGADIQKEFNTVNKALKLDPQNATLQAQSLELMRQKANTASKELAELSKVKAQLEALGNNGTEDGARAFREYQREVEKAKKAIEDYNKAQQQGDKVTESAAVSAQKAAEATVQAEKGTKGWADVLKGNLLSGAITTGLSELINLISQAASKTLEVGTNFEDAMAQVSATAGVDKASAEYNALAVAAEQMGATTKFSAAQSAEALNFLSLAGYNAKDSIAALPEVLKLAQAGGMDLAATSDLITDSMSALSLITADMSSDEKAGAMSRFADQLASGSQHANASVEQLGQSILTIGADAQKLKGGTVELVTELGLLADVGLKGAQGGTELRNVIASLTSPTADAKKALDELKVSVYDTAGDMRGLPDIIDDLNAGLQGMSTEAKTDYINKIFNKNDIKAINALLSTSSERVAELTGYVANSEGVASAMADTLNDTLSAALASCNSAFEGFVNTIYKGINDDLKGAAFEVSKIIGEVTNGIEGEISQEKLDELTGRLTEYLIGFGNTLKEKIVKISNDIIPKMLESINQNIGAVSHTAADVVYVFVRGLITNLPLLADGAFRIIEGLATGIADNLPELIPTVIQVMGKIGELILSHLPLIVNAAEEIVVGIVDGLLSAESLAALSEACVRLIDGLITAFIGLDFNFFNLGLKLMGKLQDGMENFDFESYCFDLGARIHDAIDEGFNKGKKQQQNDYLKELRTKTKSELEKMRSDMYDERERMQEALATIDKMGFSSDAEIQKWLDSYTIKSKEQVDINSLLTRAKKAGVSTWQYYNAYYGRDNEGNQGEFWDKTGWITDAITQGLYRQEEITPNEADTKSKSARDMTQDDIAKTRAEVQAKFKAKQAQREKDEKEWREMLNEAYKLAEEEATKKAEALAKQTKESYKARLEAIEFTNKEAQRNTDELTAAEQYLTELKQFIADVQGTEYGADNYYKLQEQLWRAEDDYNDKAIKRYKADIQAQIDELDKLKTEYEGANADDWYISELENIISSIDNVDIATEFNSKLEKAKADVLEKREKEVEEERKRTEQAEKDAVTDAIKGISDKISVLESIRGEFEDSNIGDKWYLEQLQLILEGISNTDISDAFSAKLKDATEKVRTNADNANKAILDAAEKYKKGISVFREGQDLEGTNISIINDLDKQVQAVDKITQGVLELKRRGLTQDFLDDYITPLSIDDGTKQRAITSLLGLTDEQLREELDSYEALKNSYMELARAESSDSANELAEEAVLLADNALSQAISQAYQIGIDTADAFHKGLSNGLSTERVNAQQLLNAQGITTGRTVQSTNTTTTTGTNTTTDLNLTVNVAGESVIRQTIRNIQRESTISGGSY